MTAMPIAMQKHSRLLMFAGPSNGMAFSGGAQALQRGTPENRGAELL
jgi:hypothetical protein